MMGAEWDRLQVSEGRISVIYAFLCSWFLFCFLRESIPSAFTTLPIWAMLCLILTLFHIVQRPSLCGCFLSLKHNIPRTCLRNELPSSFMSLKLHLPLTRHRSSDTRLVLFWASCCCVLSAKSVYLLSLWPVLRGLGISPPPLFLGAAL